MASTCRTRLTRLLFLLLIFGISTDFSDDIVLAAVFPSSADQVLNIPYFSEYGLMASTLTLNNNLPESAVVDISVYNTKGEAHVISSVNLAPMIPTRFALSQLVSTAKGDFNSGSIRVDYQGPSLGVTGQVSIVSAKDRLSFESFAAMGSASTRQDAIAFIPSRTARAAVALTNAGGSPIVVTIEGGQGKSGQRKNVALGSRETTVVELNEFVEIHGSGSTTGLFTLTHNGDPEDLLATGFILDPKSGFSSSINFTDRKTIRSSKLAGAHFRVGPPDKHEGFPEGTSFTAILSMANFGPTPSNVRVALDVTLEAGNHYVELESVGLGPGQLRNLDCANELKKHGIDRRIKNASVEITYDTAPGSLIASLMSKDETGDLSFDTPVKDPAVNSVGGTYPFRLDNGLRTVLHLKNTANHSTYAIIQVRYEGGNYNPERIRLGPHQTFGFDLKEMRDAQEPDIRGGIMPSDVASGQVIWYAEEVGTLIGRAEVFSVHKGVASSFSCPGSCNDSCPPRFHDHYMDPAAGAIHIEELPRNVFIPMMRTKDCMDTIYGPFDMTSSSDWQSQYTNIATVSNAPPTFGRISPVALGVTGITALFTAYTYGQACTPIPFNVTAGAGLSVFDFTLTPSPTDIQPADTGGTDTTTLTVQTDPPVIGLTVNLQAVPVTNSGGHSNHAVGRPTGTLAAPQGVTNSNGTFQTTYSAPIFGGTTSAEARIGSVTRQRFVEIYVPSGFGDLAWGILPEGSNYTHRGVIPGIHDDNWLGIKKSRDGLVGLANDYAAGYPGSTLGYNDMSLINGGKFDNNSGQWIGGHNEHRVGRNCDVWKENVPADRHSAVVNMITNNGGSIYQHGDHWHVRF